MSSLVISSSCKQRVFEDMFLLFELTYITVEVDLFDNKVKAEIIRVLENELLDIANNFVCNPF